MSEPAFVFHQRQASGDDPAGVTVSRTGKLPTGDFRITEWCWPDGVTLWFVDGDNFTEDERQAAYRAAAAGHARF